MTDGLEVSSRLQQWAGLAGYTLTPASATHDGRALFWSAGGEVRLFVEARDDGWFIVTRSDRLGEAHFEFAANSSTTIDKYLFGSFGQSIRSNRGLPVIPIPSSIEEVSTGFSIETRSFDGIDRLALIAPDGSVAGVSSGGKLIATASLIELSLYLSASTDDIMTSCLDPDGKPLFSIK